MPWLSGWWLSMLLHSLTPSDLWFPHSYDEYYLCSIQFRDVPASGTIENDRGATLGTKLRKYLSLETLIVCRQNILQIAEAKSYHSTETSGDLYSSTSAKLAGCYHVWDYRCLNPMGTSMVALSSRKTLLLYFLGHSSGLRSLKRPCATPQKLSAPTSRYLFCGLKGSYWYVVPTNVGRTFEEADKLPCWNPEHSLAVASSQSSLATEPIIEVCPSLLAFAREAASVLASLRL